MASYSDGIGVKNLQALQDLIDHQTLAYDFSYPISIPMDVPVVIVSEGRSLFKNSHWLPFQPQIDGASDVTADDELLDPVRAYLLHCRKVSFDWPDETLEKLEAKFLERRKETGSQAYGAQEFSRQLELYR